MQKNYPKIILEFRRTKISTAGFNEHYCNKYFKINLNYRTTSQSILHRGLFIGRFQPFHLGHLATIKFALTNVEELIIAIGSAEKSHELRNPFTAGERIEMIKSSLDADTEIDIGKIFIIPVPDINIHSLWTHQVDVLVPKYNLVFSNDPFTCILFREKGKKVIEPALHQRDVLSATQIRCRMIKNGDWKRLVTLQTVKVIEDIHGIKRIKAIFAKNSETSYRSFDFSPREDK